MEEVNWGMIGCGDVTEVKSGPLLYKTKDSNLVAVMRRNKSLVRNYAFRHNVPSYYIDVDKLINNPQVNAVYTDHPTGYLLWIYLTCCCSRQASLRRKTDITMQSV
jgi:predicted dehydrogenase